MRPRFFLAEAIRSIRANAAVSIAATVTVLIAVFMLGAFIPSFLYVQSTVDSQKSQIDIRVFISDAATVAQVNDLQNELVELQQQGLVKEFTYITKDEALEELRGRLKDPSTSSTTSARTRSRPTSTSSRPTRSSAHEIIAAIDDQPADRRGAGRLVRQGDDRQAALGRPLHPVGGPRR